MKAMGIIFTNDASLGDLTDKRTMASLPYGGRYRQVDFALSNLSCAGIRRIGIISRHNFQSLMNHVGDGEEWGLEMEEGGLEFLTPYAQSANHSYHGKLESLADAMDFLDTIKLNLFASEIFVFTPKGEIRTMPAGSTTLDFAFSIHTFVGSHCIGAKVNHKLVPINYKLNSGDQVEILTSKSVRPTRE